MMGSRKKLFGKICYLQIVSKGYFFARLEFMKNSYANRLIKAQDFRYVYHLYEWAPHPVANEVRIHAFRESLLSMCKKKSVKDLLECNPQGSKNLYTLIGANFPKPSQFSKDEKERELYADLMKTLLSENMELFAYIVMQSSELEEVLSMVKHRLSHDPNAETLCCLAVSSTEGGPLVRALKSAALLNCPPWKAEECLRRAMNVDALKWLLEEHHLDLSSMAAARGALNSHLFFDREDMVSFLLCQGVQAEHAITLENAIGLKALEVLLKFKGKRFLHVISVESLLPQATFESNYRMTALLKKAQRDVPEEFLAKMKLKVKADEDDDFEDGHSWMCLASLWSLVNLQSISLACSLFKRVVFRASSRWKEMWKRVWPNI